MKMEMEGGHLLVDTPSIIFCSFVRVPIFLYSRDQNDFIIHFNQIKCTILSYIPVDKRHVS